MLAIAFPSSSFPRATCIFSIMNPNSTDFDSDHSIGNHSVQRNKPVQNQDKRPTQGLTPKESAAMQRRIRELDSDRNPASLAEQIAREKTPDFDRIQRVDSAATPLEAEPCRKYKLLDLQRLQVDELKSIATELQVNLSSDASKQQLVFAIMREQVRRDGLMYGEGTLEILPDGFGFLRSPLTQYLSCPDDIYVSPSQIRRFNLETGITVSGQIRPPKENERYFALLRVEAINHQDPNLHRNRKPFESLTPLHPKRRIILETEPDVVETRVVDLICPIGFGQRGLIVSPPRAGKTILMQKMARAVLKNYPDAYVMMLLIDERPEEVTDMQREVKGPNCEVVSSTFDEPASRHIQVATMVMEKAKRLVEHGVDVVVFLDSITRLARAFNSECPPSGKTLSGGVDANALQRPKAFFGYARKVEEGGSLTILATALVDTGSRMDEVIFEEFKGTGNMEIVLDRRLVDQRIWPSINIGASGTRREEMFFSDEEMRRLAMLRRSLNHISDEDAMMSLTNRLRKTANNAEFLMNIKETD